MSDTESGQDEGPSATLGTGAEPNGGPNSNSPGQEGTEASSGSETPGQNNEAGTQAELPTNWKPLMEAVPDHFHSSMAPVLKEWDQNYNKVAQAYSPFKKQFVDRGISADDLASANQLYEMVNNNPQEVLRRMAGALHEQGVDINALLPQDLQRIAEAVAESENEEEGEEGEDSPKVRQLQEQMNQFQQKQEQQQREAQYNQQVEEAGKQIDSEVAAIKQSDPNVNMEDLFNRYAAQITTQEQAQRAGQNSAMPSMKKAYEEQQKFIQSIRGNTTNNAGTNAPKIIPSGGGGIPPDSDKQKPSNQEERVSRAMSLIHAANNQN